jgi:hypothetical protein
MLCDSVVQEVKRLLFVEGLSQRTVAIQAGVSRGTVHAIARGKRPDRVRLFAEEPPLWNGPPKRCPHCGAMVYMPCLACQIRAQLRNS